MAFQWPSGEQSLREKVAPYRDMTAGERLRAVARLFEFYRGLVRDPERRARWESARNLLENEGRAAFRRLLAHGP